MIQAFPLWWPDGWPRAKHRKASPYKITTDAALEELLGDLRLMGARNVIVSSNVPLRRDGTMYRGDHAEARMPDPGVAVYWDNRRSEPKVIPCDCWYTVRENVRALGMAISYLRGLDRCGAGEILDRAFQGFSRLPAAPDCWKILGIERGTTEQVLTRRYHELARKLHPDQGGTDAQMAAVNQAYSDALREVRAS